MGIISRGCNGVVESLSGREFMLTGETSIDGEHVLRAELKGMIEAQGGRFRDTARGADILVVGELRWTASDWLHNRSKRVIFVERERQRGNHICMVDDVGISALLRGSPARCLESRRASSGGVEIKRPSPAGPRLIPLRLRSVGHHDPTLLAIDLSALDRGSQAHEEVLAALIAHLEPTSVQRIDSPQVDAAWIDNREPSTLHIAEVKSLTDTNQTQQLRLGVGQLLDYRQQLIRNPVAGIAKVKAHLITQIRPDDERWQELAQDIDLDLAWAPDFSGI
ncbi:hypothetical protein NBCG_01586 [Nocardioidaceae bacterium Broad-1]|nr:hypothetical protein NBCG_01586 [Nocardioidaceae bacterium Broad-1]